jgi:hypothetical protein
MENSKIFGIMQAMVFRPYPKWWQRLLRKLGWRPRGTPVWGDAAPTILGVCSHCGAVVLEGWHRQTPGGLLCQRCAGKG